MDNLGDERRPRLTPRRISVDAQAYPSKAFSITMRVIEIHHHERNRETAVQSCGTFYLAHRLYRCPWHLGGQERGQKNRNRLRGFKFMVGGTGLEPVNLSHVKRPVWCFKSYQR